MLIPRAFLAGILPLLTAVFLTVVTPPVGAAPPAADGYVGVIVSDMPPDQVAAYGLSGPAVIVVDVVPQGPAFKAGLRPGDAITSVNRRRVASADEAYRGLTGHPAGRQVLIGLVHLQPDGRRLEIEIAATVEPRPAGYPAANAGAAGPAGAGMASPGGAPRTTPLPTAPKTVSPATPPAAAAPANTPAPVGAQAWPPLQTTQGHYFRWALPAGWRGRESMSGVEIASPDGTQKANFLIVRGTPGSARPEDFAVYWVGKVPGNANVRLVNVKSRRQQASGYPGNPWNVADVDIEFTSNGMPMRSSWVSGVVNVYGVNFDGILSGYSAPSGNFDAARFWLWTIANAIAITNPRQVAGNDQIIAPRNNPLDNSALIASWRRKGISEDRISQSQREGMMGYERMMDPRTRETWNMPFDAYDGAVGGYRNPQRPGEILVKP